MDIDPWGDLEAIQGVKGETEEITTSETETAENAPVGGLVGIAPMSMGVSSYSVTGSGSVYWGNSSTNPLISPMSLSRTISRGVNFLASTVCSTNGVYGSISSGYLDINIPVSYTKADYESVEISGSIVLAWLVKNVVTSYGFYLFATGGDLLINGTAVQSNISFSSNGRISINESISMKDYAVINQIGFRFYFVNVSQTAIGTSVSATIGLHLYLDDNITLSNTNSTSGLLGSIIAWLMSIRDGISNVASSIASLPGKIADLIIEGIKGLFIPSEEDITAMKAKYQTLLEERLGFIYQVFDLVLGFFSNLLAAFQGASEYTFQFPGISVPVNGQTHVLLEPTKVDLNNTAFTYIRPIAGTAVAIVCVIAFANTGYEMVAALISGVSYFEFLKRKKEGAEE